MSCNKRSSAMNLDLNSMEAQRSRTMSLSDLVFDELLSPLKTSGNCRSSVTSAASMTPTPTQFLFPTSVTAEQEAYASGFARALEEIYRSEGQLQNRPKMVTLVDNTPTSSQFTTLNNVGRSNPFTAPPSYSLATAGICSNVIWPGSNAADSVRSTPMSYVQPERSYVPYVPTGNGFDISTTHSMTSASSTISTPFPKNGSQYTNWQDMMAPVSDTSSQSTGSSSCLSLSAAADSTVSGPPTTVDLDEQDQWRLERKRAKNRVAAARCQMRKMERITRLQEKVQELRNNNARLAMTVAELTNHISILRKQILMHTEHGCRMMIPAVS